MNTKINKTGAIRMAAGTGAVMLAALVAGCSPATQLNVASHNATVMAATKTQTPTPVPTLAPTPIPTLVPSTPVPPIATPVPKPVNITQNQSNNQAQTQGGGQTQGGAQTQDNTPAYSLAGDWLGPMPGDTGGCGNAYSEWFINADGSYSVTNNSADCGGFVLSGTYQVSGSTVDFHQTANNSCPLCTQVADIPVTVTFIDGNSIRMSDGTFSYTYHRQ